MFADRARLQAIESRPSIKSRLNGTGHFSKDFGEEVADTGTGEPSNLPERRKCSGRAAQCVTRLQEPVAKGHEKSPGDAACREAEGS